MDKREGVFLSQNNYKLMLSRFRYHDCVIRTDTWLNREDFPFKSYWYALIFRCLIDFLGQNNLESVTELSSYTDVLVMSNNIVCYMTWSISYIFLLIEVAKDDYICF